MKTELRADEAIVREGPANLQRGAETVGGQLTLTNQRLVFEAHRFNVQREPAQVPLAEVASVTPCWTKFLGFVPLVPNSLAVTARDGTEYRFVLWKRAQWKTALDALVGR